MPIENTDSLGQVYSVDGATLQNSGNVFSIKNLGVDSAQIAALAVTNAKIASQAVSPDKSDRLMGFYSFSNSARPEGCVEVLDTGATAAYTGAKLVLTNNGNGTKALVFFGGVMGYGTITFNMDVSTGGASSRHFGGGLFDEVYNVSTTAPANGVWVYNGDNQASVVASSASTATSTNFTPTAGAQDYYIAWFKDKVVFKEGSTVLATTTTNVPVMGKILCPVVFASSNTGGTSTITVNSVKRS